VAGAISFAHSPLSNAETEAKDKEIQMNKTNTKVECSKSETNIARILLAGVVMATLVGSADGAM
jgi:hypothetical protein